MEGFAIGADIDDLHGQVLESAVAKPRIGERPPPTVAVSPIRAIPLL